MANTGLSFKPLTLCRNAREGEVLVSDAGSKPWVSPAMPEILPLCGWGVQVSPIGKTSSLWSETSLGRGVG